MEFISYFITFIIFIWSAFPFLLIVGIACFEIFQIVRFKKKNGNVIWKPKRKIVQQVFPFALPIFILCIVTIFVFQNRVIDFLLIAIFLIIFIPFISGILKQVYFGIYEIRIVGDQFVTEWDKIENIFYVSDGIRIVDRSRGVIEFKMNIETINKIKPLIENRYIKYKLHT